jgi:ferredoxin
MKYKISLDTEACIGCGACAATYPKRFELDSKKGKSKLKGSEVKRNDIEEVVIEDKEFEKVKEVAEVCPVNAIHLLESKSGKKII